MPSSLSFEERADLGRLLGHVADKDRGFIPDEAYGNIHKLVPWPTVEVLVHDENGRFLLRHREDEHFHGWHIIGGYMKPGQSTEEACSFHMKKDGVPVTTHNHKLIGMYIWKPGEHPFANSVSLVIACRVNEPIEETNDLMWFDKDSVPRNLLECHIPFIQYFIDWWSSQQRPAAQIFR